MRVLVLSHYALPHVGGIEVVVDALARELARRGHEVVHVASAATRAGEAGGAAPGSAAEVVRVPALNLAEERLGVPWPLFSPQLVSVLRRQVPRADVVHAHGLLYLSSLVGLRLAAARARRGPSRPQARVLTEHVGHVDYESPLLDRVQALALRSLGRTTGRAAQALVALNPKVEAELARLVPGRPVRFIPNGVDLERYRPPGDGERAALRAELGWDDRPRALFVGRLVEKKGVDLVLDAAVRGAGRFEAVVVGPGRLEREAPAHVELRGALPMAEVARLYRAADAFLLPSRGEGFPVTAQEALASGLPVLLRDDPSYAPYVEGAGGGMRLVAPDGAAIAAAIAELTGDAAAHAAAAHQARAHAERRFSWRQAADAHEALYCELREGADGG